MRLDNLAINIKKADIRWSYISLFLFNGINLLLLPFILAYLTPAEVGLWYTFTAISSLVVLLDLGFMTTLSRNITFIWSGINEISTQGFDSSASIDNNPNYILFVKVFKVTKIIYLILASSIYLILLTLGSLYIYIVSTSELTFNVAIGSWIVYSTAVFLNMRYAYWNAILKGIGAIKENQQLLIVTKVTQLVLTVLGLLLGYGLVAVAVAYLISIILNRVLANIVFFSYESNDEKIKPLLKMKLERVESINLLKTILPNAYKQSLISISNFINIRSISILSSAFLGLSITGSLGFILQVVSLINVVANTFFNTYLPQFSAYRLKGQKVLLRETFKKAITINYFITIIAYLIFLAFSNLFVNIINSDLELLPLEFTITIMLYMFLYNNHVLFSTFLSTSNTLIYYKAFLISSILVLSSQLILVNLLEDTLWSLILPLLIINLLYNNWKWPFEVIKDLNSEPKIFIIDLLKNTIMLPFTFIWRRS